jgi:hypothetical protein
MMLKAGVPDGAILNSFLPEGIEEEEGKEILEKLKAIKAKRAEDARKAEEEEELKRKKAEEEEKANERIAAERLRLMKQGSVGSNIAKKSAPQAMHRTLSQPHERISSPFCQHRLKQILQSILAQVSSCSYKWGSQYHQ